MSLGKFFKSAICIILTISMTGCAAMFHGTTQQVAIRSNMEDAKLYVNEAYIGQGSGVTTFQKSKNYIITVRKAGCADTTAIPTKSFDAVTLLGIFWDFGLITILIIDGAATGAWQQFDQTSYVVDPNCGQAPVAQPAQPVQAVQQVQPPANNGGNFSGGSVVNKK